MLIYAGDSLLDTGNLLEVTSLGTRLGESFDIFGAPGDQSLLKNPGQIGYSSVGLDCADITGLDLGYIPEAEPYIDLFLGEFFFGLAPDNPNPIDSPPFFDLDPLIDFSVSAATTGDSGSTRINLPSGNLGSQPLGLLSQADYIGQFLNSGLSPFYGNGQSDLFVSAGGNDILDALLDVTIDEDLNEVTVLNDQVEHALFSPSRADDRVLIDELTGTIVSNISQFIYEIQDLVDDVAVLGPPKLAETPLLLGLAEQLNSPQFSGGGFAKDGLGDELTRFVSTLTRNVNQELSQMIRRSFDDAVMFIDGERAFDAAITRSYRQFPDLLSYQQAYFADDVHPNDSTSIVTASYLSGEVLQQFGDFG